MKKQLNELEIQLGKAYNLMMMLPYGEDQELEEYIDQLNYEFTQAMDSIRYIRNYVKDKAKEE